MVSSPPSADETMMHSAHAHSFDNWKELSISKSAACFCCRQIFDADSVIEFIITEKENTAQCPHCGIDAVIGDASGYDVHDVTWLNLINSYWFSHSIRQVSP